MKNLFPKIEKLIKEKIIQTAAKGFRRELFLNFQSASSCIGKALDKF